MRPVRELDESRRLLSEWPLTVDEGRLVCDNSAVTFVGSGNVWAVNGMAATRGAAEIEPIWKPNPATGARVNIGPLISLGLELCD